MGDGRVSQIGRCRIAASVKRTLKRAMRRRRRRLEKKLLEDAPKYDRYFYWAD